MAKPTSAEFISLYGVLESTELSNLDDASATAPVTGKIDQAIDLAYSQSISFCPPNCVSGKLAIYESPWLILAIARYILDILRRRPDVTEDYKQALAQLKQYASKDYCNSSYDPAAAAAAGLIEPPGLAVVRQGLPTSFEFDSGRAMF